MRVAVIGSGGVGGFVGGLLARAGHDVALLARGAHLAALREHGLRVRSTSGNFDVPTVRATDAVAELGPADLFLFTVKTYDTEAVAAQIRPLVAPGATVLTLQNGINNHEIIDATLGAGTALAGTIRIETTVAEPGVIAHTSKGYAIRFGEVGPAGAATTDESGEREGDTGASSTYGTGGSSEATGGRAERILAAFEAAGIKAQVPDDMRAELWDKFRFIVPFAGLTTTARAPIGDILAVPELAATLEAMYREAAAVSAADGADPGPDAAERTMANVRKLHPGFKSSMQRDLERGKPLEVDGLLGAMARLGQRHGIPTPVTDTILGVLTLEDRRARVD